MQGLVDYIKSLALVCKLTRSLKHNNKQHSTGNYRDRWNYRELISCIPITCCSTHTKHFGRINLIL